MPTESIYFGSTPKRQDIVDQCSRTKSNGPQEGEVLGASERRQDRESLCDKQHGLELETLHDAGVESSQS